MRCFIASQIVTRTLDACALDSLQESCNIWVWLACHKHATYTSASSEWYSGATIGLARLNRHFGVTALIRVSFVVSISQRLAHADYWDKRGMLWIPTHLFSIPAVAFVTRPLLVYESAWHYFSSYHKHQGGPWRCWCRSTRGRQRRDIDWAGSSKFYIFSYRCCQLHWDWDSLKFFACLSDMFVNTRHPKTAVLRTTGTSTTGRELQLKPHTATYIYTQILCYFCYSITAHLSSATTHPWHHWHVLYWYSERSVLLPVLALLVPVLASALYR
jgi:hypothetical protein